MKTRQLRTESQPAEWRHLDLTQQEAFRTIVTLIGEAVDLIPPDRPRSDLQPGDLSAWLSPSRATRTVFLSGGRGSGKTTLLTSIVRSTLAESTQTPDGADEEFLRCVYLMRGRVVWLEPLDMETMPLSANLLTAILARVEDSARRLGAVSGFADGENQDYRPRGLLDVGAGFHDAVLQLQRLQTDTALAWESNLKSREGHLDADSYAVEVLRGERARLSLNPKLEATLDALARQAFYGSRIRSPLFVLPVDDVDLNPVACLDLLKLLRMISVPRLFTLLLGDVQVADLVLNLKLSNDLARVFIDVRQPDLLALQPIAVATMAGEIAANALRKLLPPNQRIVLEPMTLVEGLNFRPLGHSEADRRMHEVLAKCLVLPSSALPFLRPVTQNVASTSLSLRDIILAEALSLFASPPPPAANKGELSVAEINRAPYGGTQFFRTTPRRLADTWLALQKIVSSIDLAANAAEKNDRQFKAEDVGREAVIRLFAQLAKSSLAGDPSLLPQERRAAAEAIAQGPTGEWRIDPLPLRIQWLSEERAPYRRQVNPADLPYRCWLVLATSKGVRFEVTGLHFERTAPVGLEGPGPSPLPRVPASTAAVEITILHDLLRLGQEATHASHLMPPPKVTGQGWMTVEYHDDQGHVALLPWPVPPLTMFWQMDLFLKSWSDALGHAWRPTDSDRSIEVLAYVWFYTGTVLLDLAPLDAAKVQSSGPPPWDQLLDRLVQLVATARNQQAPRSKMATEWLNSIPLLLMPEAQLSIELEKALGGHDVLKAFWKEQREAIVRLRAQRLAELLRAGFDKLVDRLLATPGLSAQYKPDMALIRRFAGREEETSSLATQVDQLKGQVAQLQNQLAAKKSPRPRASKT